MTITISDFPAILAAHSEWCRTDGKKGKRADLRGANLRGAIGIAPPRGA